jgi:hypothetical protein
MSPTLIMFYTLFISVLRKNNVQIMNFFINKDNFHLYFDMPHLGESLRVTR